MVDPGNLDRSRQPRKGSRDEHRENDRAADADPSVASRLLTLTDRPDLITERRPPQQEGEDCGSRERDEQPGMHAVHACGQTEDDQ